MSRSLRAQISLIFTDEDLFDNFIIPLKENKELSGTIIKLLSAYYNSAEVQGVVDGYSINNDSIYEQSSDSKEMFTRMRQTLAMQDFLFEQVKQTLNDGISEVDVLMKVNDLAKQSGVVKTENTEVGEVVSQFNLENTKLIAEKQESSKPSDSSNLEDRVGRLENTLNEILSIVKSNKDVVVAEPISRESTNVNSQDNQNSERLSWNSQGLITEQTKEQVSGLNSSTNFVANEDNKVISQGQKVTESVQVTQGVLDVQQGTESRYTIQESFNSSTGVVETTEDVVNTGVEPVGEDASDFLADALADLLSY